MEWRVKSPCSKFDLAQTLQSMPPEKWGRLLGQLDRKGVTFALLKGETAVACAGLIPLHDRPEIASAWFAVAPAEGGKAFLRVFRAIALTFPSQGYSSVITRIETPMGRRIARLLGFEPVDEKKEIWAWVK